MRTKSVFRAATTALTTLGIGLCAAASAAPPAAARAAPVVAPATEVTWFASAGLGYDSNPYLAPSSSYVDYAALPSGSNPVVVPRVQSGFFVPLETELEATHLLNGDTRLRGSANLDGHVFLDSDLSKANVYNARLRAGPEFVLDRKGKIEDRVYAGVFIGKHRKVYFDRDSGTDKTTAAGADISQRYSYVGTGIEADYSHRTGAVGYGVNGKYARNDFEDPVVVSQLDHTFFQLGATLGFSIAPPTKLALAYDHSVRDYSDRHARNAQGVYSNRNPMLVYTYNDVGMSLRQRLANDWVAHLDYDYSQREDGYVGYNDSNQHKYGARVLYRSGRLNGRLALEHWIRDYPNAFAYDEVVPGIKKTYDGTNAKLKAEWERSKHVSFWSEATYVTQDSSDLRYAYDRNIVMVGMGWTY